MKRPLLLFSIAMTAGILEAYFSRSYPLTAVSAAALLMAAVLLCLRFRNMTFILIGVLLFYNAGAFGFLYRTGANSARFGEFSGKQVLIRGYIDSEPDVREAKTNYTVRTSEVICEGKVSRTKGKILLSCQNSKDGSTYRYGTGISAQGTLYTPKGRRNPGGFNYKEYLSVSGISATMFSNNIQVEGKEYGSILIKAGIAVRHRIAGTINRCLPEQQAGLLGGMLIGYRDGLTEEVQQAFSDAGLSHIMAVSGMNTAFIVMPLVFIFKRLGLRERTANPVIILALIVFVFITGFTPSVVRAAIMAITILAGQLLRRETDGLTSISFAAVLLLLYNPLLLFDLGFQLSFAATLSLVLFYRNVNKMLNFRFLPAPVRDILAVTLAAQLGVIPLTAFHFNKISIVSFISNILAVPMLQIITILGAVMVFLGQFSIILAQVVGYINCSFLSLILYITKVSSELPLATLRLTTPAIPVVILYYVLIWFFFWYKPLFKPRIEARHCAAVLGVIILAVSARYLIPGKLDVLFIDVGEGDAALIRTYSGKTVLIDGGGYNTRLNPGSNIGDSVIIPLLMDMGVSKLDAVIATHGHDDHIQGLIPVLGEMRVKALIVPENGNREEFNTLEKIAVKRKIPVEACRRGDIVRLDERTFLEVLSPEGVKVPGSTPDDGETALNNSSLVVKLHYKKTSMLFTGDMQKEAEDALMEDGVDLSAGILKVAHHGSLYSTQDSFLELVKPGLAVISVGRNNFGHPSPIVLKRLEDKGIQICRTDMDGGILLTSDGEKIRLRKTIR